MTFPNAPVHLAETVTPPQASGPPAPPAASIPSCELSAGTSLQGYHILRTLGAGGFGITYLAWDHTLQRKLVIKEHFPRHLCDRIAPLPDVTLRDPAQAEAYACSLRHFRQEYRLLATLRHPCIPRIYTCLDAHNTSYYTSEYIEGSSLSEIAARCANHGTTLSPDGLYATLIRLLDTLNYLHEREWLHLDIKPDNIIISPCGLPKLIDFGAAHHTTHPSYPASVVESTGFTPAEQYNGSVQLGPWSDIYALGATFYYLLTLECLPDARVHRQHILTLAQHPTLSTLFPAAFLASLDRAICPNPADRYCCAAQWLADLRPPP